MIYSSEYNSPLGKMTLLEEDSFLIGLYFNDQNRFFLKNINISESKETPTILETKRWLDIYFSGKDPKFKPKLAYGSSPFQTEVLNILLKIPYGYKRTYGDIAKEIRLRLSKKKMSSQAIGNAISHNPICLIIPCHRVLGKNDALVGYAGGIERKIALLEMEKISFKMGLEK